MARGKASGCSATRRRRSMRGFRRRGFELEWRRPYTAGRGGTMMDGRRAQAAAIAKGFRREKRDAVDAPSEPRHQEKVGDGGSCGVAVASRLRSPAKVEYRASKEDWDWPDAHYRQVGGAGSTESPYVVHRRRGDLTRRRCLVARPSGAVQRRHLEQGCKAQ